MCLCHHGFSPLTSRDLHRRNILVTKRWINPTDPFTDVLEFECLISDLGEGKHFSNLDIDPQAGGKAKFAEKLDRRYVREDIRCLGELGFYMYNCLKAASGSHDTNDIPSMFISILDSCIADDQRFPSARQLVSQLEELSEQIESGTAEWTNRQTLLQQQLQHQSAGSSYRPVTGLTCS